MVEQGTFDPRVAGSIPVGALVRQCVWVTHQGDQQEEAGDGCSSMGERHRQQENTLPPHTQCVAAEGSPTLTRPAMAPLRPPPTATNTAFLAQSVEHETLNLRAAGSSPAGG